MVNNKKSSSTKAGILEILRNPSPLHSGAVSGEQMAETLGLSRVAIWKAIRSLNENGYRIVSNPSGYILETDPEDSLCTWEFAANETRFRYWDETDSTMNRAREAALSSCEDGLVFSASRQSNGRGTASRKWESVPGGLFFTIVTKPSLNAAWAHRQVIAAQCAMVRAIRSVSGIDAVPVWPNDILVHGTDSSGKAGGILCESMVTGNQAGFINLGIGINTGTRPSLAGTAAIPSGRKELLDAFLDEFSRNECDSTDLVREWNALCPFAGKEIQFSVCTDIGTGNSGNDSTNSNGCAKSANGTLSGIFHGIDNQGYALVDVVEEPEGKQIPQEKRYPPGSIAICKGIYY